MENLVRANKCTAYWGGNGVAIGNFYKTHDKVCVVRSDSEEVEKAGYTMLESTEESPVTAQDKLAHFKDFIMANATVFGVQYDPVDRRQEGFKFPNTYQEDTFRKFSYEVAVKSLEDIVAKVQNNVIDKLIKSGHKPDGTNLDFGIDEEAKKVDIAESYKNGNLKYATAEYEIMLRVAQYGADGAPVEPIDIHSNITVELVSGQIKKPRSFDDDVALTMAGMKQFLIDGGAIPKIEKPKKDEDEDDMSDDGDTIPAGQGADDAPVDDVEE